MLKRIGWLFGVLCVVQQVDAQKMRDVFATMPDSIIHVMTKNNRLDCIDFIENNIEAKVRNRFDGYTVLKELTHDFLRLQVTKTTEIQMKLLPSADTTYCVCIVRTQKVDSVSDSRVEMYAADWSPIELSSVLKEPSYDAFWHRPMSMDEAEFKDLMTRRDICFINISLSAQNHEMVYTLFPFYLEEASCCTSLLQPLRFIWEGGRFVAIP